MLIVGGKGKEDVLSCLSRLFFDVLPELHCIGYSAANLTLSVAFGSSDM